MPLDWSIACRHDTIEGWILKFSNRGLCKISYVRFTL